MATSRNEHEIEKEWQEFSDQLSDWARNRLLVRTDTFPEWDKSTGSWKRRYRSLHDGKLSGHFRGFTTIGAYTTDPNSANCKYLGIDIDAHDDDPRANRIKNWMYARDLFHRFKGLEMQPLLEDSNNAGGFHLWIMFSSPVSAEVVHRFGCWLTQDAPEDVAVEVFPKQPSINDDGFGNQLRLPGRHHKKGTWSTFYDEDTDSLLGGSNGINILLNTETTSSTLIPHEAMAFQPPVPASKPRPASTTAASTGDEWWRQYKGNLATLDIEALCEDRLTGSRSGQALEIICPWCDQHTTGDGGAYIWPSDGERWPSFYCHHAHCSEKRLADLLAHYGVQAVDSQCDEEFRESPDAELREMENQVDGFVGDWDDPTLDEELAKPYVKPAPPSSYKFAPMSFAELGTKVYEMDWLIQGMLVANQPVIVGGPKKSLKTNVLVDMTISLGSGTKFLGEWNTAKTRTLLISGESGGFTIQETVRRVADSKGLTLDGIDAFFAERLPRLSVEDEIKSLTDGIRRLGVKVVIIDPLYLCLLSDGTKQASNLYDMGPLLLQIADACLSVGATPILAHHARKNLTNPTSPLDLEDLAFSGISEFARQWILLNRREAYRPKAPHKLWLASGGSVGHGGLWGLTIDEGALQEDFTGRIWDVQVQAYEEIKKQKREQKLLEANQAIAEKKSELVAVVQNAGPLSKSKLCKTVGGVRERTAELIDALVADGLLEIKPTELTRSDGRSYQADALHLAG